MKSKAKEPKSWIYLYQSKMEVHQKGTQSHRKVWVARDFKGHLVPTPCDGLGHLPLEVTTVTPEDDEFEVR